MLLCITNKTVINCSDLLDQSSIYILFKIQGFMKVECLSWNNI